MTLPVRHSQQRILFTSSISLTLLFREFHSFQLRLLRCFSSVGKTNRSYKTSIKTEEGKWWKDLQEKSEVHLCSHNQLQKKVVWSWEWERALSRLESSVCGRRFADTCVYFLWCLSMLLKLSIVFPSAVDGLCFLMCIVCYTRTWVLKACLLGIICARLSPCSKGQIRKIVRIGLRVPYVKRPIAQFGCCEERKVQNHLTCNLWE